MKLPPVLSFLVLPAVIVFLLLAGAGIYPWTVLLSLLLLAAGILLGLPRGRPDRPGRIAVSLAIPVALLVVAFTALTVLPLPGTSDRFTGARRVEQNNSVRGALQEGADLGLLESRSPCFSLTRNRAGTHRTVLLGLCAVAAAILGGLLPERQRSRYTVILLVVGVATAVAGFTHQWLLPREKTLWWFLVVPHGRPVGCFINRVHYGGFLAALSPFALARMVDALKQRRWIPGSAAGLGYAVMAAAVCASLSRSAVVALVVGAAVVAVAAVIRYRSRFAPTAVLAIAVAAAVGVAGVLLLPRPAVRGEIAERLQTLRRPLEIRSAEERLTTWQASLRLWRDYPLLGVGANGFRMIFPRYRSTTERKYFVHAENEYLTVLLETGIVGVLLTAAAIGVGGVLALRGWRNGGLPVPARAGAAGALAAVAVHNALDFPLHVPLYTIVFASVLGLLAGPGTGRFHILLPRRAVIAFLALAAAGALVTWASGTGRFVRDDPDQMAASDRAGVIACLVDAPTAWPAWERLGYLAVSTGRPEHLGYAERCMEQATLCDPKGYRAWKGLGIVRQLKGDTKAAQEAFATMKKLRPWEPIPPGTRTEY